MDTTPDEDEPSTSTSFSSEFRLVDFDSIVEQAKAQEIDLWKGEVFGEDKVKFELFDNLHCLPKYSVEINKNLEILVLVCNWPLSKNHGLYQECRQAVQCANISQLLKAVKSHHYAMDCLKMMMMCIHMLLILNHNIRQSQELFFVTHYQSYHEIQIVMLTLRLLTVN